MAKSRKRSPRSSSKKRYSKKGSRKRYSKTRSSKRRSKQSPCRSFRTKSQCYAAKDRKGLRRCTPNVRTGRCQDLPTKYRTSMTTFTQYAGKTPSARPQVGRLSPERLQLNKPTMMETESGQIVPLAPGNVPRVKLASGEMVPVRNIPPPPPGMPGVRMERTASGAMIPVAPAGPGRRIAFAYAFY
jgi:hypothetical protein